MRKVFLENLPSKGNGIDWKNSIGHKVPFVYDDIEGEIKIINYIRSKKQCLVIEYDGNKFEIYSPNLIKCRLGRIIGLHTDDFKINLNDEFKDGKRSLKIIDREYRRNVKKKCVEKEKWYKYYCNKCGNEDWIIENAVLGLGVGCNVCNNRKTILGINTIWDTDRWMCDLGVSEEDAKKYSKGSTTRISVTCPDCGREKKMKICNIYSKKSICCPCGDGKSYPEKFVINLLEQLNIDFESEYNPKWTKNKKYDFYISSLNTIIETHGLQHYEFGFERVGGRTLEEEQINDRYKKEMALRNGIKYYIELDCRESNINYIKNGILNSQLNVIFDLSKVDWNRCAEFANKNIVKEVCSYWNNKKKNESTIDIGKVFKLNKETIRKYLKRGAKLGWCNYNGKEESIKGASKSGKASRKRVEIFKDGKSLGVFESCVELSRRSEELFGVKLSNSLISQVCNNYRKQHKNFIFKYVKQEV